MTSSGTPPADDADPVVGVVPMTGDRLESPLPGARMAQILGWLVRRYVRVVVTGESMSPTLCDGDQILVDPRSFRTRAPEAGDVVLARHPFRGDLLLVKRVVSVTETGELHLVGDNPAESTDSRSWGCLPRDGLEGRVICVLVRAD